MPNKKLKVLHIGKYYAPFHGGIEKYMQELIESDAYRSEVDTRVIVHDHDFSNATSELNVNGIKGTRCKTNLKLLFAPISISFFFELKRLIKAFEPDIIHFHVPNLSAFYTLLIPQAKHSKWVVQWHSDVIGSQSSRLMKFAYCFYRFFERRLLLRSDAVICSSPNYLESSNSLKGFKKNCHVIPLGIKQVEQSNRSNKYSGALKLLIVGRLSYYKGHLLLLDALRQTDNVTLTIVGQGESQEQILSFINKYDLSDKVTLTGSVSEIELFDLYRTHDLLCLPSIERTEAFGVVLIEAASVGLPALVSDVQGSGMSWVVQDGETGIVVTANDTTSIVNAINKIQTQPALLQKWAAEAQQRFERMFKISAVSGKTLALYKNLATNEKAK